MYRRYRRYPLITFLAGLWWLFGKPLILGKFLSVKREAVIHLSIPASCHELSWWTSRWVLISLTFLSNKKYELQTLCQSILVTCLEIYKKNQGKIENVKTNSKNKCNNNIKTNNKTNRIKRQRSFIEFFHVIYSTRWPSWSL